jgi:two-component system, OmpR family, sensor histidine kinase MtrB
VPRRVAAPRRLRRRLTVAFVLVAAIAAGALAAGSYLLVRQARLRESQDRAIEQAERTLQLAGQNLSAESKRRDVIQVLDRLAAPSSAETVAVLDGRPAVTSVSRAPADIPSELNGLVQNGGTGYQRTTLDDAPHLVIGTPALGGRLELYTFVSEQRLHDELADLGVILLIGWGAVVLVAGLVGSVLARRTLAPVARASDAARSLAEGLLQTRLPEQSDDEFGAWAASFNRMAEALEARIADLREARDRERRFTSDVSHELRTPLTALVSEASLLREHLDRMPEEARRPAEMVVGDVARLRWLVEDLMEISRLDAGGGSVRVEPVEVGSAVAQTVRGRGWDGRVALALGDPVVVNTDRRRLERIVGNLVGNALEHGGRDVSVRAWSDHTGAFVEVADRGPGIRPEDLPHLFDRFYKADPSRSSPGSGLGLAIAMENARLLGGDIDVRSEAGVGTRFTLHLPVTEPLRAGEPTVSFEPDDEAIVRHEGGRS